MIFTSEIFIYFFMPSILILYFGFVLIEKYIKLNNLFLKSRLKDIILIVFSLIFYSWNSLSGSIILFIYMLVIYFFANLLVYFKRNILLFFIISMPVLYLVYVKYFEFIILNINLISSNSLIFEAGIPSLGISFITFSAISYLVDIYRGDAIKGSLIDCLLYLTFFPKIISGPIVLWKDFQPQIKNRIINYESIHYGVTKIIIGFGKKAILADQFSAFLSKISYVNIDPLTALGTLFIFPLQIYYDFSGYSDIAIGLSSIFGFKIYENFNYPYKSTSITEFWKRWHISLGRWFREYIYIPLRGNRVSNFITIRNLGIIFFITGIWHGASFNYIIWGCLNGLIVIIERLVKNKNFYKNTPVIVKRVFTLLLIFIFWQIFRFEDLNLLKESWKIILGLTRFDTIGYTWKYYFDTQIVVFIVIGIILSFLPDTKKFKKYYKKFVSNNIGFGLQQLVLILIFLLSILYIVNSSYTPFLYFQF